MLPQQLDRLVPPCDLRRRGFVRSPAGSGFAAAVLPALVHTAIGIGSQGGPGGEVSMSVSSFNMPASRHRDRSRGGLGPGVKRVQGPRRGLTGMARC